MKKAMLAHKFDIDKVDYQQPDSSVVENPDDIVKQAS